jgi:NSS family neurotransmitter:Na+ symporter
LIVSVLPALFETMGAAGVFVAMAFFLLMTIASLTSSISMLEVPVSYTIEHHGVERHKAALAIGSFIAVISLFIVFNFDPLFDMVVTYTTEFSQPLLALFFCVFVAWIWHRNEVLAEIKQGYSEVEAGLFWKIWPFYVKYICPLTILLVYFQ